MTETDYESISKVLKEALREHSNSPMVVYNALESTTKEIARKLKENNRFFDEIGFLNETLLD